MTALTALKHVARFEYGDALAQEARAEGEVPVYGSNGITGAHDAANTLGPAIIVGRKGSFGKITWTDEPGFCIDTAYFIDSRSTKANLRWLYWSLQTLGLDQHSEDTGVPGLSREKAYQAKLKLPPSVEQERIADFLDEQTARIDALIAEKERLISTLQRASIELLHDAVTKGLHRVPMNSSSREWIGDMPAHWSAPYIRFVARLESGHTPSRQHTEYWLGCNIPWFSLADVWQIRGGRREVVTETAEMVSELGIANSAARLLPAGTVMLSRTASVGFSAIMGIPMATTQDFVNWVCGPRVVPAYLLYVFRSMGAEFARLKFGSTHSTIYMPEVAKFSMPLPPVEEQQEIVAIAGARKEKMDALGELAQSEVERLREYRSSLISAAVTGQLNIDDFKALPADAA